MNPTPAKVSREVLAQRIATFVSENRLAQIFGGDVVKREASKGRHFYVVGFSQARILDGEVHVWGEKHVAVLSCGPCGDGVDRLSGPVFESVDTAIEYMKLRWVDRDSEAAARLPTKPGK